MKGVVMKLRKKIELLNHETIQMSPILAQGIPAIIAIVIVGLFPILDQTFQMSANNPFLFNLVIGISIFIAGLSFLVIIVQQEIAISLLAVRGKLAILIGFLGLAVFWRLGIGMIIQYFNDIASLH
jgi:hypothetical protein